MGRGGEGKGGEGANKVLQPAQSVKSQPKYDNYIECTNNKATVNAYGKLIPYSSNMVH